MPLACVGLMACMAKRPVPPRPEARAPGRCDAFQPCPEGQRCLLGVCEPIDCRSELACTEIGLCSLRAAGCVAATDDDCRSCAACRRLGLCRAIAGTCAARAPVGCSQPDPCDPSGICLCPLQRNLGRADGPPLLSAEAVKKTFATSMDRFKACYEHAARRQPGLSGKLVLDFTIGSNGRVTRASCSSITAPSVDLALCVLARIRVLVFERRPGGPIDIRYPLIFRSAP